MTRSELFTLMTCGMATIAGTVMVLYATILKPVIPGILGHILTASIISAPAAILISKIMILETQDVAEGRLSTPTVYKSVMDHYLLCHVRFCKPGEPGYYDRRHGRYGAGKKG